VLSAKDSHGNTVPAAIAVMQQSVGVNLGNVLAAMASIAMWFCGLSCVTSASRALYSLARDEGVPGARIFKRVNPRFGTPGPAIWAIVLASFAAMAWTGAIPVVTSLSTVSLYLAYIIPVVLGYRARSWNAPWTAMSVWTLGRWGSLINVIAIVWAALICVILVMPPNQLAGLTFAAVIVALTLMYRLHVRHLFRLPHWVEDHMRVSEVTGQRPPHRTR
jgi:amino acid transporter